MLYRRQLMVIFSILWIVCSVNLSLAHPDGVAVYGSWGTDSGGGEQQPTGGQSPGDVGRIVERTGKGPLKVGFASLDITPDWPVFLPYGKKDPITARYGDPCYVKATVFEAGGFRVAFVELDIIGIRMDAADEVKTQIEKLTGISKDFIIVAATHNHAYPRIFDPRESEQGRVRKLLVKQSSEAVKQALGKMFPARIGIGKTTLRRDIVNNREKLMGPTLTDLYAIRIDDMTGNLRGVLFDFGAHPVVFTKAWGPETPGEIGPDWPGYAESYIEAQWRLKMLFPVYNDRDKDYPMDPPFTMFALGAAGDQVGLGKGPTVEERNGVRMPSHRVMTEVIADSVLGLIDRITTTSDEVKMVFRAKTVGLTLRERVPVDTLQLAKMYGITRKEMALQRSSWERPAWTLVQALTFNDDTALLMIPAELTADLGIRIRDGAGFKNSILITLANDAVGYITTEEEALEGVTYAGKGSSFDHARGRVIANEVVRLVNPGYAGDPPVDPATRFGAISGQVGYPGDQRVVVGVMNKFEHPSTEADRFWGKRVLVDTSGSYTIDRLLPGEKFIYVREVKHDYVPHKSGYEGRTFFYARPVVVRAKETTEHVDFFIPQDFFATSVKNLTLDDAALQVEGNTITGRVTVDGSGGTSGGGSEGGGWKENEPIVAEIYVYGVPYSDFGIMIANPYLTVPVSRGGEFRFNGVPPGRYTVACWLDVNRNGFPEPGVDLMAGPSGKILEVK